MKEFYIAPEAEIICFAPVEKLAYDDSWMTWSGRSSGDSGSVPEVTIPVVEPTDPSVDGEVGP